MDLPTLSTQKENQLYKNFLHKFEENANAETVLKLSLRIEELENQLLDQHQLAQKRELELHKQFDQKKYKWILKYLEIKLQLEKLKETNNKIKKNFCQDLLDLSDTVQLLLKKSKERDELQLTDLKALEKDIAELTAPFNPSDQINKGFDLEQFSVEEEIPLSIYPSPTNTINVKEMSKNKESVVHLQKREQSGSLTKKTEIPMPILIVNDRNREEFSIDSEVYLAAIEPKQDQDKENKFNTPQAFHNKPRDFKGYFRSIYKDSTAHTRSASLNSVPSLSLIVEPIQKKILEYITKTISDIKNFEFENEIKKALRDIDNRLNPQQGDVSFSASQEKSLNKEKNQRIVSNLETKRSKGEVSISKIYTILENNITPNNQYKKINKKETIKGLERNSRVIERPGTHDEFRESKNKIEKDIFQMLQDLQNSLSLSDREMVLNTLMNVQEKGFDLNDIKLEELLDVQTHRSKDQSLRNGFTPSLCMKYPLHIHKDLGQYRNYSSYDRGLPMNSKSSRIINNNLSQQKYGPSQMNMESHDIIDARKYLDSYYDREYFRNESENYIDCSIELNSQIHREGSNFRSFHERILRENMSPILPQKDKSQNSRMNICEENIPENNDMRSKQITETSTDKENVNYENISKPESENKISSETNGTANLESYGFQLNSNKQSVIEKTGQGYDFGKNKEKQNSLFCFRVCGNKMKE